MKPPDSISRNWPDWLGPLPDEKAYTAACERYEAARQPGDWSDFSLCLSFAMATYAAEAWAHFFFPERAEEFQLRMRNKFRDAGILIEEV